MAQTSKHFLTLRPAKLGSNRVPVLSETVPELGLFLPLSPPQWYTITQGNAGWTSFPKASRLRLCGFVCVPAKLAQVLVGLFLVIHVASEKFLGVGISKLLSPSAQDAIRCNFVVL